VSTGSIVAAGGLGVAGAGNFGGAINASALRSSDYGGGSEKSMTLDYGSAVAYGTISSYQQGIGERDAYLQAKNFALFGAPSSGGGTYMVFIANRQVAPTSNPVGGGILYAEAGALKWRGSAGTTTTIAVA
jgi:hypothetical protein